METLREKFTPRIKTHVQDIALQDLCRINPERLETKAIPNIGCIELVSGSDFALLYDKLYIQSFPNRLERERSDLITDRLEKAFAGERSNLAPYYIIGIRDRDGAAIGAAQFSVLKLLDTTYAVPYLQYIYVRHENRRQDMAEVLHTMILAVAAADAVKWNRSVPFTLFECEPANYGIDEAARTKSTQRVQIHTRAGAVALMLRQKNGNGLQTPHVQPGLELGDDPLMLVWAVRFPPKVKQQLDVGVVGSSLMKAYYQSLRDEGFPEANIALAEGIANQKCQGYEFVTMPLADVTLDDGKDIRD